MKLLDTLFLKMFRRQLRGTARLAGLLDLGGRSGRLLRFTTRYGSTFELDPFEYIDAHVLREGFYESEVFEAAIQAMPENGVFWDVGANIGLHAISMASRMPGARVFAFEPSPREFARLVRSTQLNRGNVQALTLGLSDREALVAFHVCQTNSGRNGLYAWGDSSHYTATLASVVRGDHLVETGLVPAPNVVKIDVEGAELEVLRGMRGVIAQKQCRAIIFEGESDLLSHSTPIRELIEGAGFRIRRLDRRENTAHNLDNYVAERERAH